MTRGTTSIPGVGSSGWTYGACRAKPVCSLSCISDEKPQIPAAVIDTHMGRKYPGHGQEVMGVNRMLGRRLTAHHAWVLIAFQAGNVQQSMGAINLLLALTLWLDRRASWYPAFWLSAWGQIWGGERRCDTSRLRRRCRHKGDGVAIGDYVTSSSSFCTGFSPSFPIQK